VTILILALLQKNSKNKKLSKASYDDMLEKRNV